MPGFVIHLLHGKFILENMLNGFNDDQVNQFMQGILMPDSNKGYEKDISHFIPPDSEHHILQIPDTEAFAEKYGKYLESPFVCGYFAHLYLDKVFFEQFFPRYIRFRDKHGKDTLDSRDIQRVYIVRRNEYIFVEQLFSEEYLYGDYTMLNASLISKYALKIPYPSELENPIGEVRLENFSHILSDLEQYFSLPIPEHTELKIFEKSELENFIYGQANEFISKEVYRIE